MTTGPQPPADGNLSELQPLEGGVSGATTLRGSADGRSVVVKYTDRRELDVLRYLAELDDPIFPRLLDSCGDDDPVWIMINYHHGPPAGIIAGLSEEVHRSIGRLHAHVANRHPRSPGARGLPGDLEVIDEAFLGRMLTSFGPDQLHAARDLLGERLSRTASELMRGLAADRSFMTAGERFGSTLIHGDLYGLNVLLPSPTDPLPLVIDWNTARYGPPMFDVAMTAPYDSDARRAATAGWAEITGQPPDPGLEELSHAWCFTMLNIGYSGVVAWRSSAADAEKMIIDAEESASRFATLLRRFPGD